MSGVEEGLAIAGLAASLAGTGASLYASESEKAAMNRQAMEQLNAQNKLAQKGKGIFEQSLSQSTPEAVAGQMKQGTQQALQEYTKVQGQPSSVNNQQLPGSQELNKATTDTNVGSAATLSNQQAAPLAGYDAFGLAQKIKDMQAGSALQQLGIESGITASPFGLQMAQAQNSQNALGGIGSLLNSTGGLASVYGTVNRNRPNGYASPNLSLQNSIMYDPSSGFNSGGLS